MDEAVKERDFLNWTIACAERTGWRVYHVPAPMVAARKGGFVGSPRAAGLPDLFLLHDDPPRLIVAELKGTGGKLSDAQIEFLKLARDVAEGTWTPPTAVDRSGDIAEYHFGGGRLVGVYAWFPNDQDAIEQMLKSKVLI